MDFNRVDSKQRIFIKKRRFDLTIFRWIDCANSIFYTFELLDSNIY